MDGKLILASSIAMLTLAASGPLRADGAKLYEAHCAVCHQPDGNGSEGIAPPLADVLAKRAQSASGREYTSPVAVSGMVGTMTSRGVKYNGATCRPGTPVRPGTSPRSMGHVLSTFNKVSQPLPTELFTRPEPGR